MRPVRDLGEHPVVPGRIELDHPRAERSPQIADAPDVADAVLGLRTDDHHGAVEQVGSRRLRAMALGARDRVRRHVTGERRAQPLARRRDRAGFGAGAVGDERIGAQMRSHGRKEGRLGRDGRRQDHQIGIAHRIGHRIGDGIDQPQGQRVSCIGLRRVARHPRHCATRSAGRGDRAADHADAEQGHPLEDRQARPGHVPARPSAARNAARKASFSAGRPIDTRNHSGSP